MTLVKLISRGFFVTSLVLLVFFYLNNTSYPNYSPDQDYSNTILVSKNITVSEYFNYLDSIVNRQNVLLSHNITEHILVRSNPWIIDTLANTDYYYMKAKDSFVYDQKEMIVLKKGSEIIIPDSIKVNSILKSFKNTKIVVNIPEFKLRIFEDTLMLYVFPIRVGRNEKKYLKMSDRITDLKTKHGSGTIVNHVKNPDYYNPVDNHKYIFTVRDDKKTTQMPQIPWVVTEINGVENGQLIHPTTNPVTLNKAYSNGCIGTKEADAWKIYYHSPIGTKIDIKYNLNVTDSIGNKIKVEDIYSYAYVKNK